MISCAHACVLPYTKMHPYGLAQATIFSLWRYTQTGSKLLNLNWTWENTFNVLDADSFSIRRVITIIHHIRIIQLLNCYFSEKPQGLTHQIPGDCRLNTWWKPELLFCYLLCLAIYISSNSVYWKPATCHIYEPRFLKYNWVGTKKQLSGFNYQGPFPPTLLRLR